MQNATEHSVGEDSRDDHPVEYRPPSLFSSLAGRFDIPWDDLDTARTQEEALAAFRDLLTERLRFIIDNDFGKLAQILYRIDVDERKVDEIFRTAPIPEVPAALADLITTRVLRTLESRRRYREGLHEEEAES